MLLVMILVAGLAAAAPPDAQEIEREAKQIEALLIAPCCWSSQVSQHYSPEADRIRAEVRQLLGAGKTRAEVLDYYVAQFGDRILAEPPARGFNRALYVLPWVFFLLGGAAVLVMVRRFTRAPVAVAAPSGEAGGAGGEYAERLDRELRDLD